MTTEHFIPRSADMLYVDDFAEIARSIIAHAEFAHHAGSDSEVAAHIAQIEKHVALMMTTIKTLKQETTR